MALKIEEQINIEKPVQTSLKLAQRDQIIQSQPKIWLKRLRDYFSGSDLNYEQWERLESKRTGYQMRKQEFF